MGFQSRKCANATGFAPATMVFDESAAPTLTADTP